jgi:hypothetical protein
VNNRWIGGALLDEPEGEIVLIAVPLPDLLGAVCAFTDAPGAIRVMIW